MQMAQDRWSLMNFYMFSERLLLRKNKLDCVGLSNTPKTSKISQVAPAPIKAYWLDWEEKSIKIYLLDLACQSTGENTS